MITLGEYETRTIQHEAPPVDVRDQLTRDLQDRLEMLWLAGGLLRLRTQKWVGVVRLPGLALRIVPKLAGEELDVLTMLAVVSGLPLHELPQLERDVASGSDGQLLDLLCRLLCREARSILTSGPLQDYREVREDLGVLRGRLDIARQTTQHFGRVDVLACAHEQFDHDVIENRLIRAALSVARRVATDAGLRRSAAALFQQFDALAPGPLPTPADVRRMLTYDRRNHHYRQAHVWGLAILEGHRIVRPFDDDGDAVSVFLLNMNELFELFVEWLVRTCMIGSDVDVVAQHRDASILWRGARSWGAVRPDLLVRSADRALAIDAKYKRYDLKRLAIGDVYQLFLYAHAFLGFTAVPRSLLLYPSLSQAEELEVQLRPRGVAEASVHCLGVSLPPLLAALRDSTSESLVAELRKRLLTAAGIPLL